MEDSTFDMTKAYEGQLLTQQVLENLKLSRIGGDLRQFVDDYLKEHALGRMRRSLMFFAADEITRRGHPTIGNRIRDSSSAIYHASVAASLDLQCALPATYTQQLLGEALLGEEARVMLHVDRDSRDDESLLDIDDLDKLDAEAILELRQSSDASRYFKVARLAGERGDGPIEEEVLRQYSEALRAYIGSIADAASLLAGGRYSYSRRLRRQLQVVRWSGLSGGVGIALVGIGIAATLTGPFWLLAPPAAGIFIALGSDRMASKLASRQADVQQQAKVDWARRKKFLGVGNVRQGL